jgi:hypothetical protein
LSAVSEAVEEGMGVWILIVELAEPVGIGLLVIIKTWAQVERGRRHDHWRRRDDLRSGDCREAAPGATGRGAAPPARISGNR